jgi:hypothetical protein
MLVAEKTRPFQYLEVRTDLGEDLKQELLAKFDKIHRLFGELRYQLTGAGNMKKIGVCYLGSQWETDFLGGVRSASNQFSDTLWRPGYRTILQVARN